MRYYVVDAFAEKVFEGNPAGICVPVSRLLSAGPDPEKHREHRQHNR